MISFQGKCFSLSLLACAIKKFARRAIIVRLLLYRELRDFANTVGVLSADEEAELMAIG